QHISSSYVPIKTIENLCGPLLKQFKIDLKIPGLLVIDTPGHEAFTTLRKRGGAIADLAILIVDINEGFQPQTEESLNYLKQFKTPFIVAATKVDRIMGWAPHPEAFFLTSFSQQPKRTQDEVEEKLYKIVGQLGQAGINADRYDRVDDYTKKITIVPISSTTGEGFPELLMLLTGISQKFLKDRLEVEKGTGKGTVLEVKEFKGLGATIDVVVYDGEIKKGDTLVIGGEKTVITKVKAMMKPKPLHDIRVEKQFENVDLVTAADGVKISAPGLDKVIAGSPLRAVRNDKEIEKAKQEVEKEMDEVVIETDHDGALLKADTLGSLEALVKSFKGMVNVRKANVGTVTKSDVMEMKAHDDPIIFAFGVKVSPDIKKLAQDNNVALFDSNVIYKLIDEHGKWKQDAIKRAQDATLRKVTRPGRIRVLHGYVFRQSKPAVFGVEVLKGIVRTGYRLHKKGKVVGEIKELQMEGNNVSEIKTGDKAAVSMEDVTIGKQVLEGDILDNFIVEHHKAELEKVKHKLTPEERELIAENQEK
ncbi:MAG: translation initiation factor IF-2, partial [Nanoarchaeota archaeon]|nr:translation initiation factor IF-2 [Nanoarchaeota archaeon]